MRELKFRAWDKSGEQMVYGFNVAIGEECFFDPTIFTEIMQYTGLKDKNGKEIYEGDIVRDRILDRKTKEPEERARIFEVYWDEKTASFLAKANR